MDDESLAINAAVNQICVGFPGTRGTPRGHKFQRSQGPYGPYGNPNFPDALLELFVYPLGLG